VASLPFDVSDIATAVQRIERLLEVRTTAKRTQRTRELAARAQASSTRNARVSNGQQAARQLTHASGRHLGGTADPRRRARAARQEGSPA